MAQCPGKRVGTRQRRLARLDAGIVRQTPRKPEVENDRLALRIDDDVRALQIAMNDSVLVRVFEGARDLSSVLEGVPNTEYGFANHLA